MQSSDKNIMYWDTYITGGQTDAQMLREFR